MKAFIVGCGRIAGGYNQPADEFSLTHAHSLNGHGFEIVGCFDPIAGVQREFEEKWSIPPSSGSLAEILRRIGKLDLLSYCGPQNGLIDCLESVRISSASPRVMILEKPVGLDGRTVDAVRKLTAEIGSQVIVNYFRAFDPFYVELQDFVKMRRGDLQQVSILYYGDFVNNCVHFVERLVAMLGEPLDYRLCVAGSAQSLRWNGVEVIFLRVGPQVHFSPMEFDFLFSNERFRVIDSEERSEYYRAIRDRSFPDYTNLRIFTSPLSTDGPSHRSFSRVFEHASKLVCGGKNAWNHLERSRMIAGIVERIKNEFHER